MSTAPTSSVRHDIAAQVAAKARRAAPADASEMARDVERNAYHEVRDREIEARRARRGSRALQFIGMIFGFVYLVIGFRIVLEALGARESNAFESFVDTVSTPFLMPFEGLFPAVREGSMTLAFSYVAALVVYAIAHLIVHMVVGNVVRRRELV